jgi:CheY-like chemotaxis protein
MRDMGYDRPIVALTANALKDAAEMFMNNGFSGFVSKPIDINQIDGYLKRFIRDAHFPPS